jgi:hypothetical protein
MPRSSSGGASSSLRSALGAPLNSEFRYCKVAILSNTNATLLNFN